MIETILEVVGFFLFMAGIGWCASQAMNEEDKGLRITLAILLLFLLFMAIMLFIIFNSST
jgi:O-antigen ligase